MFTPNDTYNYTYTLKCYSQLILADKEGNKSLITNEKVTLCLFRLISSYCFNELFQLFVVEILRLSSWGPTNSESTSPLVLESVSKNGIQNENFCFYPHVHMSYPPPPLHTLNSHGDINKYYWQYLS